MCLEKKMHSRIIHWLVGAFAALLLIATLAQAAPVHAKTQAKTLSIQSVYVTDSGNHAKSSFKSGDGINYHIVAYNSGTLALDIGIDFEAYTNNSAHIVDKRFSVTLTPNHPVDFYTRSKIPAGAVSSDNAVLWGQVWDNADSSNSAIESSSAFSIAHVSTYPLNVPPYYQFDGEPSPNELCGETSVAMVISYYIDDLQYTDKPWQLVDDVVNTIGVNKDTPTTMQNLSDGLWNTHENQIGSNSSKLAGSNTIDQIVQTITTETKNGNPVIAFVDGTKLTPKRSYVGHWLVITGIVGSTVYVNDPDDYPGEPGKRVITDKLSLDVYKAAAITTEGVKNQGSPSYGLVVTGP